MDMITGTARLAVFGIIIWLPVLLGLSRIARPESRLRRVAQGGSILLYTTAVVLAALLGIIDPSAGWARYGRAGDAAALMVGLPWNVPLLCLAETLFDDDLGRTWTFWISWFGAAINIAIVVMAAQRSSAISRGEEPRSQARRS